MFDGIETLIVDFETLKDTSLEAIKTADEYLGHRSDVGLEIFVEHLHITAHVPKTSSRFLPKRDQFVLTQRVARRHADDGF